MKILHVITSLRTGGAEKLLVDLLPRFKAMGHDVELLLFDGTITPFYKSILQSGIKIHSLSIGQSPYNLLNILRLRKYIRNYDIIHTHNTACQYFIPIANIIFNAKCTLITTEHSTHNRRRNKCIFKFIDRYIYSCYNHIVTISKGVSNNLQNHIGKKNSNKISLIYNGIDLMRYNRDKTTPQSDSTFTISMIAGFRPEKDHKTLLKAISLLPSNYNLWLIGEGVTYHKVMTEAANLKIRNRTTFWGERTDIPNILKQSHVIVLISHWEGFGLSVIEGMAANRPIVATDIEGINEIVNGYGILVPPNDPVVLAQKIKELCENPQIYIQVSKSCFKRSQDFDINNTVIKYSELYSHV